MVCQQKQAMTIVKHNFLYINKMLTVEDKKDVYIFQMYC
jgi:hypothetical protein